MSEKTVVNVNLKFEITETGAFPPYEGICRIECTGADGKEWKGSIRYDDGRSVEDAIKTICRMESFRGTLPKLLVAASNSSEEKPKPAPKKSDPYMEIAGQLMGKKVGELRKIISDQNLGITTGGKKKGDVVKEMVAVFKSRDGITE
jgi:hypothetical protein